MSKVKVTKEQMEAFNRVANDGYWTPKRLITDAAEQKKDWGGKAKVLNDVDLKTMTALLFFPELVEVDKTPEEELLDFYHYSGEDKEKTALVNKGVEMTLKILDIKIKGINA